MNSAAPSVTKTRAQLSIEHKLPLLIGSLLVAVIIALSAAAYAEVRSTSFAVAGDRLTSLVQQFRDLFQQSGVQLRGQVSAVAAKQSLADFVRTRSAPDRDRALADLASAGPQPEQVLATEIRDSTGAVLLSTASSAVGIDTMTTRDVLPRTEPGDSAIAGRFRSLRDTIVYPVAAPIRGAGSAYVVRWRRVAGSRRAREQITRLIGSDASLMLGNPGGSQWTDLERPVAAPPLKSSGAKTLQTYARGAEGKRYLAAAASVPGTPWMVAVDFPISSIMGPVESFMWKMAAIAMLALVLGLLAAWMVSRRLTAPLSQLTDAADAIARGDYSRKVHIRRSDEIGRLGIAFATMAGEVQLSRNELEQKVEERTKDLNDTLRQLSDAQESLVRREKLAMLGQLASGVGHELRNPLGVMTNAVYFLKMVLKTSPTNVLEYLNILQQQITLSEKIVSDLLDFARSKPPQRNPASLQEVTEAQLARLGATNGVRINAEFPSQLPPVLVDQTQIGQIVLNLLTNALQALDGRGSVGLRAHEAGDRVHLDVSDTGPGVAPENIEKIFEPLFTTKARGIGLGLAVSRTLARANEGDLTVRSMLGQGATFRLTLPTARAGGKAA